MSEIEACLKMLKASDRELDKKAASIIGALDASLSETYERLQRARSYHSIDASEKQALEDRIAKLMERQQELMHAVVDVQADVGEVITPVMAELGLAEPYPRLADQAHLLVAEWRGEKADAEHYRQQLEAALEKLAFLRERDAGVTLSRAGDATIQFTDLPPKRLAIEGIGSLKPGESMTVAKISADGRVEMLPHPEDVRPDHLSEFRQKTEIGLLMDDDESWGGKDA
jgi:hypothetical protein